MSPQGVRCCAVLHTAASEGSPRYQRPLKTTGRYDPAAPQLPSFLAFGKNTC